MSILAVSPLALRAPAVSGQDAETGAKAAPASEPQPAFGRVVEEIIVTAQKTKQNIQDVPISMTVLGYEFIKERGITNFVEAARYIPNVGMNDNPPFSDFRIRGFGTNPINKAFEQAVGLVLDGVPYGRPEYFLAGLYDVERVEVLRGPQGTLFGKNATAGLFNVVTKNPGDDFTGSLDAELGEIGRRRFEGALGGPVVKNFLNFRIAGRFDEMDGYGTNTTARISPQADDLLGGHENAAVRVKLGLPNLYGVSFLVAYERFDADLDTPAVELGPVPEKLVRYYRFWDSEFDAIAQNYVGSIDGRGKTDLTIDAAVANASYEIGGFDLDAVAGHAVTRRLLREFDPDHSPAPAILVGTTDEQPQTTFELRGTSPTLAGFLGLERLFGLPLGSTDFTAGFFYQHQAINDSAFTLLLDSVVLAQELAVIRAPEGAPIAPLEAFIGPAVPIGSFGVFDTTQGDEITQVRFDQSARAVAGFGQINWAPLGRWTLQYGMRFSQERKAANWDSVLLQGTGLVARAVVGREQFQQHLELSEFHFTPRVTLKYDWTRDINVYAGWAKGFRAGGFNEFASNADPAGLRYKSEDVTSYEAGVKMDLLDGAARLNVGLFWMNLTNFQVLTLEPREVIFEVVNAGKARSRGVELDGTLLPATWLTLVGTLGFDDTVYLEFPFGSCVGDRLNTDGDDDERCDLAGEPLDRTPKWVMSLTPTLNYPLASIPVVGRLWRSWTAGIDLTGGLTAEYKDVHFIDSSRDPRVRQPAFFRFHGHLGFSDRDRRWSLGVTGQNLTNEYTRFIAQGAPLSSEAGTLVNFPDPPRAVFATLRWSF